jgi:ClpP class serine protease
LTYLGRQALDLGLIDELGGRSEAIEMAAEMAHISNYEVIDLEEVVLDELYGNETSLIEDWIGAADEMTGNRILPPGIYLLYDSRFGGAP